jgi:pimeloyl-ACP methyl ester carboxylesterase
MSRASFALLISAVSVTVFTSVGRPARAADRNDDGALGRTIMVPFDHKSSAVPGTGPLYFQFGARFDASKPTVLIVADGQQYYVRKGSIAKMQKDLFGDAFNVVGIVTRGTTPEFIKAALDKDGRPDWMKAWIVFNSDQWVADIDAVRKNLVGENGSIMLYGKSGGAYLVQHYLTKHGASVKRAFIESPFNPFISRELGIEIDTYWRDLGARDMHLQPILRKALEQKPEDRIRMLIALQRQHFYEPVDNLPEARRKLIRALAEGDTGHYKKCRKKYEVDAVMDLYAADEGIPQRVRIIEFFGPTGEFQRLGKEAVLPLVEQAHHFSKPLLALLDAGKIPAPTFDFAVNHRLETEVFLLGCAQDGAVDYRTTIAVAHTYPRHQLFIANDNHLLMAMVSDGSRNRILRAFLAEGPDSAAYQDALSAAQSHRWTKY